MASQFENGTSHAENKRIADVSKRYAQHKALAETLPSVQNGLLNKEQIIFSMGHKEIVNPASLNGFIVRYNAIGPDLSTVLFATNAAVIDGIERARLDPVWIRYYYQSDEWDFLDRRCFDPARKPELSNRLSEITDRNNLTEFQRILGFRKTFGYWHLDEIKKLILERSIMLECKMLGVKREDIDLLSLENVNVLEFLWAYPGEAPKKRIVRFHHGSLFNLSSKGRVLPSFDCLYEKSRSHNWTLHEEDNDLSWTLRK